MSINVTDNTLLITGANRGIGKAILERAAEKGAKKIYAAVRRLESAEPLVAKFGSQVQPILVDLEQPETIELAAEEATDVGIVVNNAGILKNVGPLDDDAIKKFQQELDVNVFGLMRMARAFAPVLKANGGGALVQLNSVASLKSFPDFATYSASKAAAYSITLSLREALQKQNTHIVSVHPGPIATDMADHAGLTEMAEPPWLVADAIFSALSQGEFFAFPDNMARQVGAAYRGFAERVLEIPAAALSDAG